MAPTKPSPATWTFRFKNGKSTTLLHVDPLQSLQSIKTELLRALISTHRDGQLGSQRIPTDPSLVLVGRPVDIHDPAQGWQRIVEEHDRNHNGTAAESSRAASGPGKKRKSGAQNGTVPGAGDCPKALGLEDNAVLAFKFCGQVAARDEGEEEDEGLGMEMDEDDRFDVVIPSYEDETGVVNQGDVGSSPPPFVG